MSTSPPPGSIVMLTRLARVVYRRATEETLGMKLKAYMTLSNLQAGAVSQQDLCISMHLDPNNCVLMLNELESAGYVRRLRDPADRRRHIVEITPEGREALQRAELAMEDLEGDVLGALAPPEREQLRDLLSRALAGEPAGQPV
jgi:MarR family transcriptional regulator, temperature-dependent positive regulator of motility